jgi:hypothetical protein
MPKVIKNKIISDEEERKNMFKELKNITDTIEEEGLDVEKVTSEFIYFCSLLELVKKYKLSVKEVVKELM